MTPDPYADLHWDPYLDPYPDLPDTAALVEGGPGGGSGERQELSEAERRLLEALTRPQPPVVTAVEDAPRTADAAREPASPWKASGTRSLAPVFQEPTP